MTLVGVGGTNVSLFTIEGRFLKTRNFRQYNLRQWANSYFQLQGTSEPSKNLGLIPRLPCGYLWQHPQMLRRDPPTW